MWNSLDSKEAEWDAALDDKNLELDETAKVCCTHALMASKQFNEIYVGGNDTPIMLQILGADGTAKASFEDRDCVGDESDALDVLVSVLRAGDTTDILYTARGERAKTLIVSFWMFCPQAELVKAEANDEFSHILCRLEDENWTTAPLSLAHLKTLRKQRDELSDLHIFVNSPSRTGTDARVRSIGDVSDMKAPLCPRPAQVILCD